MRSVDPPPFYQDRLEPTMTQYWVWKGHLCLTSLRLCVRLPHLALTHLLQPLVLVAQNLRELLVDKFLFKAHMAFIYMQEQRKIQLIYFIHIMCIAIRWLLVRNGMNPVGCIAMHLFVPVCLGKMISFSIRSGHANPRKRSDHFSYVSVHFFAFNHVFDEVGLCKRGNTASVFEYSPCACPEPVLVN